MREGLALTGMMVVFAACGSVNYRVNASVDAPRTVAVLPIRGAAPSGLRDVTRQLLHSRLQARGYRLPELAWVDRVLSEHDWLRDPERFTSNPTALAAVIAALQVDALLITDELDESSFNVILLRRHAVNGSARIHDAEGREYWSAGHGASNFGGFLLTSGQVFAELRAQGEHGTAMASLALADEFVADIVGTIPLREAAPLRAEPPRITHLTAARTPRTDGSERILVRAHATTGATLRFELAPHTSGVPMVQEPGHAERYQGEHDIPFGTAVQRVVVRARDAFGRETASEIAW